MGGEGHSCSIPSLQAFQMETVVTPKRRFHLCRYDDRKTLLYCSCSCSVTQSCPTLCNPKNYNRPGSSVHGISQARILEQVAMSSSRASSQPRDWTHVSCTSCIGSWIFFFFKPLSHLGHPVLSWEHKLVQYFQNRISRYAKIWNTYALFLSNQLL